MKLCHKNIISKLHYKTSYEIDRGTVGKILQEITSISSKIVHLQIKTRYESRQYWSKKGKRKKWCFNLVPTNSSHDGIRFHSWTVSNGPKSNVRHSALSNQLWSTEDAFELAILILLLLTVMAGANLTHEENVQTAQYLYTCHDVKMMCFNRST